MGLFKKLFGGKPQQQPQSEAEILAEMLVTGYRSTLDRMQQLADPSIREFVSKYLTAQAVASDVCAAALEKMVLTDQDRREHSKAWTLRDGVMIGVQTIPASRTTAAEWFTSEFGGYSGYCTSVVEPILRSTNKDVLAHIIFGQDRYDAGWQVWTQIAVLPLRNPNFVSALLPRTCCNAAERERYKL